MLSKNLKTYIAEVLADQQEDQTFELYKQEKEYAEKHELVPASFKVIEKQPDSRFSDAYIERGNKETEEMLAEESPAFLNQSLDYLNKQKHEFIYLDSNWFEIIGVDGISLEVDDVFGTYDVMTGVKLQKKYEAKIKDYLQQYLGGDEHNFDLMFNQNDGLWDLNFPLNAVNGFSKEMSIGQAYQLIYQFLFELLEKVEDGE